MLRRSTSGPSSSPTTTITTYTFGLEEHAYTSAGVNTGNLYYYFLGGRLIGSFDGTNTIFYLTDMLGSIVSAFSNVANSAAIKGNQLFGPYGVSGTARYLAGSINTAKGFTGQYNDALTGLDYYNARYYDPAVGVFLSADGKQGNAQGMNPYTYVNGNPETYSDPSGNIRAPACYMSCSGEPPVNISFPSNSTSTTSSSDAGWPFGKVHPGPLVAQAARIAYALSIGNYKEAVSALVTFISLTNIPTPDLSVIPSTRIALLNDEPSTAFADALDWFFGKGAAKAIGNVIGGAVDIFIGGFAIYDLFTTNSSTQRAVDGLTATAYILSLSKGLISRILGKLLDKDPSEIADSISMASILIGGFAFAISLANSPFTPHAGNDDRHDRRSASGGPPFPPIPPIIPPMPNLNPNGQDQDFQNPAFGW